MKELEELKKQLADVKRYSLLAAKSVFNLDEAAMFTGLSKSYLYKLTCGKEIPFYRPNGKLLYFDRSELEAWLKQNRNTTNAEVEEMAANYRATGRMGKEAAV